MNTTVIVPAEHAEDFRQAVVSELAFNAKCVTKERQLLETSPRFGRPPHGADEDLRLARHLLTEMVRLFDQVNVSSRGALMVAAPAGTLAHVFETMAQRIVGPRVEHGLECGPLDEGVAGPIRSELRGLRWALDRSAELHAVAVDQPTAELLAVA